MGDKGRVERAMEVLHPRCAGIDVGKRTHWVAVDDSMDDRPVRSFGSVTEELESMSAWLSSRGVDLVDARSTKQVSGRKSDVLDCQWIRQLASFGLLRGAFRPADRICELRSHVRQRGRATRDRARCVQHVQKALTEMNVQLDNVLSDVMGATGQRILRAIVRGGRDGAKLARFRDPRVKADEAAIARSPRGNWRAEHLFALEQALERYDLLTRRIKAAEGRIDAVPEALAAEADGSDGEGDEADGEPGGPAEGLLAKPGRTAAERRLQVALWALLGVDLTAIPTVGVETALALASEIGPDLSRFPTQAHFCSWLALAPDTRISGGKPLRGPPRRHVNRAGQALRMAAASARNSDSCIGARHRARLRRLDGGRAVKATAHEVARLIYAMLTRGEEYVVREIADFEAERKDRQIRNLRRQARRHNLVLVERKAA